MTDTLFELRTESDMRREALAENQRRIHDALMGLGPYKVTQRQRRLLEMLRGRQGRLLALPISEIIAATAADPRSIKADVRDLVMSFHLPIVSSRDSEDGGYFFAVTAEERISGTADYVKEIIALAQRVRIIRGHHDLSALFGQISTEMPTENERSAA